MGWWTDLRLGALVLLVQPSLTEAQQSHCDPGLRTAPESPVHYQARGSAQEHNERCEGIYIREVAGSTLLIASFTAAFGDYNPNSAEPLHIAWPAVAERVRLRAYSLRERLYYRMDTEQPPGVEGFNWPTTVLAALNVGPRDIGVIGWVQRALGAEKRDVYLPLQIQQQAGPPAATCCRVVLLPGRELEEVYLTLAPVDAGGRRGNTVRDGVPLKFGYYPAGRGIVVPITGLPATPGLYVLELAATFRGGGSAAVEFWFHNPGN